MRLNRSKRNWSVALPLSIMLFIGAFCSAAEPVATKPGGYLALGRVKLDKTPPPDLDARLKDTSKIVPTPQKLQAQIDELTQQIETQRKEITDLKTRLTTEENKPLTPPPPKGYTRFFITKNSWDNLSGNTGMDLYARIDGK